MHGPSLEHATFVVRLALCARLHLLAQPPEQPNCVSCVCAEAREGGGARAATPPRQERRLRLKPALPADAGARFLLRIPAEHQEPERAPPRDALIGGSYRRRSLAARAWK